MFKKLFPALLIAGLVLTAQAGEKHKFIGAEKCKVCHKTPKAGKQYQQWVETKHAKAFETLKSEEAVTLAKEKGITQLPHEAPECLKCHVTAHGVDAALLGPKFNPEDGVQCETCHGAGGDYAKKKIMKNQKKAVKKGLIIPTEELCRKCHNEESPTFESFDFEEMEKKITHPIPPKKK